MCGELCMNILFSVYAVFLFVLYVPNKPPPLPHEPLPRFCEEEQHNGPLYQSLLNNTNGGLSADCDVHAEISALPRRLYASRLDVITLISSGRPLCKRPCGRFDSVC